MNKIMLAVCLATTLAACSQTPIKTMATKVDEVNTSTGTSSPVAPIGTLPSGAIPSRTDLVVPAKPLEASKEEVLPFPPKGSAGLLGQRSVFYGFDTVSVPDEYKSMVAAHAEFLAKHPTARMTLQGNADERGSHEYNLALGARRAEGVKSLMTASGALAGQIEVTSFGKEKPVDNGHDEASWAKNRRVDLVYQGE